MKNKIFIILSFFIGISIITEAQDEHTFVKEGDLAPGFEMQTVDGRKVKLQDMKGKVVWLNFFATWCPPCRQELPELEKLYQDLKDNKNFELFVIGREHDSAELKKFITEHGFTFPFVPDPKREIFSKYAAQNIPRNFIIGKNRKIEISSTGYTPEEFKNIIAKLKRLLTN